MKKDDMLAVRPDYIWEYKLNETEGTSRDWLTGKSQSIV